MNSMYGIAYVHGAEFERRTDQPLDEWVALNLYAAASELRAGHDGSGDPMPDAEAIAILAALKRRVEDEWRPSLWPEREAADEGLRAFVRGCIAEVERRRKS